MTTVLMATWCGCGGQPASPSVTGGAGGAAADAAAGTACPPGFGGATVSALTGATAVSAGPLRSCALKGDGTVSCWGADADGSDPSKRFTTPVTVRGLTNVTEISVGSGHACAVQADGTVMCWGNNNWGQLGHEVVADANGGKVAAQYDGPVSVQGLSNVISVSAGTMHSCAVLADTTVRCWGNNQFGQLGNGATESAGVPVAVSGLSGASKVSAGIGHSCAIIADGAVQCWGAGTAGQLGNGSREASHLPVSVAGLSGAVSVSAGWVQSCAIMGDGGVQCWGASYAGELSLVAAPLEGVSQVTSLSTALDEKMGFHSCVAAGGLVQCWGSNMHGQFGNGSTTSSQGPVAACGVTGALAVATTSQHTCALLSDGTVACWGSNVYGQLGTGSTTETLTPVLVTAP